MDLHVIDIASHRNGISGNGFYVVIFEDDEDRRFVGIVFEEPGNMAVLKIDLLSMGDIAFGSNSWACEEYEDDLRAAIKVWEAARRPARDALRQIDLSRQADLHAGSGYIPGG